MEAAPPPVDWFDLALSFLGGLALFLYGVNGLAGRLREVGDDRIRGWLSRGTANRISGLFTGVAATVVLDSSSATIILLIALIDAQLISLTAALPVILGSNIGTTISSQVFAWSLDDHAPLILVGGLGLNLLGRSERARGWGLVIFNLGLILFALGFIGDAAEPLEGHPRVRGIVDRLESPLLGVAAGALLTVLLQSSSAMLGVVIVLASQGVVTLEAGLALMLGAEIGTVADTLVATIQRSAAAVRAGVFHFVFNLVSAMAGLALLGPMADFARWSARDVGQEIANAQLLYNVVGALAFLLIVPWMASLLKVVVPERRRVQVEARPA